MSTGKRRLAPGLYCRETGRGQRVLLLHCSAGSGAQWRALAAQLAGSFRVLAPDLHGYGASALRRRTPLSLTGHAMLLSRLLEDDSGPVHLVGHSFGGAVALRLAALLGRRVRSLALIEPVAFQLLRPGDAADAAALADIRAVARDMEERVVAGHETAAMRRFIDYWNGAGSFDALPPPQRAALAAQADQVIDDFAAIDGDRPVDDDLESIQAPTLVLQGGRSPRAARIAARRVAAAIPGAQRVRIRDAGHMAPVTHPEIVNLLLTAHLDLAEERESRVRVATLCPTARPAAPLRLAAQAA